MITLHHLNDSRSQRILWLLEELNVPYQIKQYTRVNGRAPDTLKQVHPLGKSPVISDGDITVAESGAIVEYLTRKYDAEHKLVPTTDQDLRDYTFWLHYAEGSAMTPMIVHLVFNTVVEKSPFFIRPIAKGISENVHSAFIQPEIIKSFDFIEMTLKESGYFVGDKLTAADIQMSFVMETGSKMIKKEEYPAVFDWLQRVSMRDAYKKALEKGGEYKYRIHTE